MEYAEQWQELERQVKCLRQAGVSGFIRDGIVNLPQWQQQGIRPLFIGKEAYGKGDWSITEHCLNQNPVELCRKSPRSWQKTAYVAFALQHGCATYNAAIRHSRKVYESLRTTAFINIGKFSAAKRTAPQRLACLYEQNRRVLHKQISLIQPNILIGWGTMSLFVQDEAFRQRFGLDNLPWRTGQHLRYQVANGHLFIAAKHPSYFKIKPVDYVNGIVDVVRENASLLQQELPTW